MPVFGHDVQASPLRCPARARPRLPWEILELDLLGLLEGSSGSTFFHSSGFSGNHRFASLSCLSKGCIQNFSKVENEREREGMEGKNGESLTSANIKIK